MDSRLPSNNKKMYSVFRTNCVYIFKDIKLIEIIMNTFVGFFSVLARFCQILVKLTHQTDRNTSESQHSFFPMDVVVATQGFCRAETGMVDMVFYVHPYNTFEQ